MSVREELIHVYLESNKPNYFDDVESRRDAYALADAMLAEHARELAEEIRNSNPDRCPDFSNGVEWAAAWIYPPNGEAND